MNYLIEKLRKQSRVLPLPPLRVPAAQAAGGAAAARQPSFAKALRRAAARRHPACARHAPAPRHDAQEEAQLRRGGGEGGAQEEIGEVVS